VYRTRTHSPPPSPWPGHSVPLRLNLNACGGVLRVPCPAVMDADEEAEKGAEQVYHLPQDLVIPMPRSSLVRDGQNFPPQTTVLAVYPAGAYTRPRFGLT